MSIGVQKKYVLLATLAVGVVILDQWTKFLVLDDLTTAFDAAGTFGEKLKIFTSDAPAPSMDSYHFHYKKTVTLSDNFFCFRYAENPGAAFGLFRQLPEGLRGPLFHLVSIGAVILILYYFRKLLGTREEVWALTGLPLVLGGAIGNYVDRLSRGFVVDFLEAHWYETARWPSFNIADSAICIGVGLLVIDSFVRKEKKAPLLEPSK
jgi:signal peptidase II